MYTTYNVYVLWRKVSTVVSVAEKVMVLGAVVLSFTSAWSISVCVHVCACVHLFLLFLINHRDTTVHNFMQRL